MTTEGDMTQMNRITGVAALLLLAGALSGCAGTVWVKKGATPAQALHQETACEAQALKAMPPDNIVVHRHTGAAGKVKKGHKHDVTVTGQRDEDDRTEDANEDARDVLVRDCMYRAGWNEQAAGG